MTTCPDCGEELPRPILCSRGGPEPTSATLAVVADFALALHRRGGCTKKETNDADPADPTAD